MARPGNEGGDGFGGGVRASLGFQNFRPSVTVDTVCTTTLKKATNC